MDAGLVLDADGVLWAREGRRVRNGDQGAVGAREDGAEGGSSCTPTSSRAMLPRASSSSMSSEVSREKPIDYAQMAQLLLGERDRGGYVVWVCGSSARPHSRSRADMTWFIENGFVGVLLAGNAVVNDDIEASMFGTTLGMSGAGVATSGGHGLHMRAINSVPRRRFHCQRRRAGTRQERHHARVRAARRAVRAVRLHSR